MTKKMTAMDWKDEQFAQEKAGRQADALVERMGLSYPIDPLRVAKEEYPLLRAGGRNFRDRFDGKLRYVAEKRCFVLMFNTKYDVEMRPGQHHPRTRFSIAHELGHYFIEHHRDYLRNRRIPHASVNEFRSGALIEREADAFAASLLLPTRLVGPMVNQEILSLEIIDSIACRFETSRVSTLIRAVQLSDFPCAVAGIRQGSVAWMFPSESLIRAGIYPNRRMLPDNAREPWDRCRMGVPGDSSDDGEVRDWFRTYDHEHLDGVYVREEYISVPSMETLLVLLTLDESDIFQDDDDDDDDVSEDGDDDE
ncbi:MAG: ImmA/IrrE family metallo-endopeptidase [Planctomycetes bacterium]|nr:ImmA/IrrE family metallo-endopeptidase [Planctomycetota bacterium]